MRGCSAVITGASLDQRPNMKWRPCGNSSLIFSANMRHIMKLWLKKEPELLSNPTVVVARTRLLSDQSAQLFQSELQTVATLFSLLTNHPNHNWTMPPRSPWPVRHSSVSDGRSIGLMLMLLPSREEQERMSVSSSLVAAKVNVASVLLQLYLFSSSQVLHRLSVCSPADGERHQADGGRWCGESRGLHPVSPVQLLHHRWQSHQHRQPLHVWTSYLSWCD